MPSYRRDRPERPAGRPSARPSARPSGPFERVRREEPEEEGEQPRGFRAAYPRSELPSRPVERRSWSDFIVPESEKRDPNFQYSRIFDIFAPGSRRAGPSAREPQRDYQASPPPRAEQRRRSGPPEVDPSVWFDLNRIWGAVKTVRQDPRFRVGSPVAVVQVSNPIPDDIRRAEEMIKFFRIPRQDVEKFQPSEYWSKLLNPFLEELAYSINDAKPVQFPGSIRFQKAGDGSMWMAYQE